MNDDDHEHPTPCILDRKTRRCTTYWPGHQMHQIQAGLIGRSPWGWRDAVVSALTPDGWVEVDYLSGHGRVVAWHHQDLTGLLSTGTPVRVHEQYHTLGAPFGWVCLFITSGRGPVRKPRNADLWRAQMTVGVTDLSTGRALPGDHASLADEPG